MTNYSCLFANGCPFLVLSAYPSYYQRALPSDYLTLGTL